MKASTLLIALSLLCSNLLLADSTNDDLDKYISQNKQDQFSYEYKKSAAESSKLSDSWISPLMLQYSYSTSNPYDNAQISQNAFIKMDQPIFQSGGIYFAIKYASALKKYSNYSIDVAKRKLVKDAISLLMQIKQMGLNIQKQNLRIKNSEISLQLKKEQYLNGQLDSGFLDNAILERNLVIQALYDMQTNKEKLISRFKAISDTDYKQITIPNLELINEEQFLKDNIALDVSNSQIEKDRYMKNITISKYLPRVSVTAGYNWSKSESQQFSSNMLAFSEQKEYYDYGLKVSMPLDVNTFVDVESSRVDYLKSKLAVKDKERELTALFEQVMQNIDNLDKKKTLSHENRMIYEKLLADTVDLQKAGYKTKFDVDLLENSVNIQKIDTEIFEIDKQQELLTLYEMYKND